MQEKKGKKRDTYTKRLLQNSRKYKIVDFEILPIEIVSCRSIDWFLYDGDICWHFLICDPVKRLP